MSQLAKAAAGTGLVAAAGYVYWSRSRPPVLVLGGGVMGLNTAERLASRGRRVCLVDAAHPIRGSWGITRASHLRMEDPVLLRMSLFSIRHWLGLQKSYAAAAPAGGEIDDTLFYQKTGAMMGGPTEVIMGMAAAVRRELGEAQEVALEVMEPQEATGRFPQVRLEETERLLYMHEGYTFVVPTCMACLHWNAARCGISYEEDTVVAIDRKTRTVTTAAGRSIRYSDLVITAGPWTNQMLALAGLDGMPMVVSNEQTVELLPMEGAPSHDWDAFPVYTWSEAGYKGRAKDGGCRYFYTTPHVPLASSGSAGVKIGFHRQGPLLSTDEFQVTDGGSRGIQQFPHIRKELNSAQQYDVDDFALRNVQDFLRAKLPGLDAERPAGYMRCLYQNTPDMQMIVGRHPQDPSVVLACGFCGSGFQFAPAIGDMLAALVTGAELSAMHERMAAKFDPRRFQL